LTDTLARQSASLADRDRIERELGQDGMDTVYLAEDLRHKRKVALTVLKPELAAVLDAERSPRPYPGGKLPPLEYPGTLTQVSPMYPV
jgi:hypothetical protein